MRYATLLVTFMLLARSWAATSGLSGGVFIATDTTATNARPSKITASPVTGATNLNAGSYVATNSVTIQAITASRALISGTDKSVTNSAVTATELGYVSGVTSGIQAQIDAKISATAGSVINSGTPVTTALPTYSGTTGTNITPSSITVVSGTNLTAGAITATNNVTVGASGSQGSITLSDSDGSNTHRRVAASAITTDINEIGPAAPFTGIPKYTVTSTTNFTMSAASYVGYIELVYMGRVDGSGCTSITNNYAGGATNIWGLALYNGTADTNANYAMFRAVKVPYDIDTNVVMVLKGMGVTPIGTDTDAPAFSIAYYQPAASAAAMPTDYTGCSGFIGVTSITWSSVASGDQFYFDDTNLTGWAPALTPGRDLIIAVARTNNANDDPIALTSCVIQYGRTN